MRKVQVSNERPPQWILDAVKEKWGVEWESSVIFTYGDLITTYKGEMTEDLLAHEGHHTTQQKEFGGADKWWKKYLEDEKFRYEQELECYRMQYLWLKSNCTDKRIIFKYLNHYADALSGPMYGNLISKMGAIQAIKA